MVKFRQTGHRELMQKLRTLDRKMQRSISGKALRAGAKITNKALRAAAPVDTGAGKRAIGTKVKTYKGSLVTVAITGERSGKRRPSKKLPKASYGGAHFHLIEFGTGERFHTGQKKAREFAKLTTARYRAGKMDSAKYVQAVLKKTGSFGRTNVAAWSSGENKRLQFSQTLRDVQSRINKSQRLGRRYRLIAADLRTGKSTGRVRPKPFFRRAWQGSIGASQSAQVAVLKRELEAAARGA